MKANRRRWLQSTLQGGTGLVIWHLLLHAQAIPETLRMAINAFTGGAPVQAGRVELTIAAWWTTATPCPSASTFPARRPPPTT